MVAAEVLVVGTVAVVPVVGMVAESEPHFEEDAVEPDSRTRAPAAAVAVEQDNRTPVVVAEPAMDTSAIADSVLAVQDSRRPGLAPKDIVVASSLAALAAADTAVVADTAELEGIPIAAAVRR